MTNKPLHSATKKREERELKFFLSTRIHRIAEIKTDSLKQYENRLFKQNVDLISMDKTFDYLDNKYQEESYEFKMFCLDADNIMLGIDKNHWFYYKLIDNAIIKNSDLLKKKYRELIDISTTS